MQYISKELIDSIKSQNDIVDVIGSYIDLNDKNKALCPFHNDHSPSFSVHKDKQIYKCFSCGESGNVITFVQKIENCTYLEALEKLAARVGIKLNINTKPKVNESFKKYYDINNLVCSFYKNNLLSSDGKLASEYLKKRKITTEMINTFDIGLSLDSDKMTKILSSKKYEESDLISIDVSKDFNGTLYDSLQNRITFPIKDENGNVTGFSGRKYLESDLKNDTLPKYYNTRETKIFNKGAMFYNINNALNEIKKKKEIIICEGQMDAIRVYSIGYKNVVALMGTALTHEHIAKIQKYKCKVILNLDQDDAGKNGTINDGEELIKNNIDVSVIVFDDYKDSDEFILNKGKDAFDKAYNNRLSYIDFKLKYLKDKNTFKDAGEISIYINEAIKAINEINDDILRELKIKELSKEFDIDESVIRNKIVNKIKESVPLKKEVVKNKKYNKYDLSEIRILYLMLNYEEIINVFENRLGSLINDDRSMLAYKIMEFRNDYGYFSYSDFIDYIKDDEKLINVLNEVNMCYNKETYCDEELDDYINTIKEYSVKMLKKKYERQMNETLDINKKIELLKKIENINKEVLEW